MRWEYKVEAIGFGDVDMATDALNTMSRGGWEVVAVVPRATGPVGEWAAIIYKRQAPELSSN